MSKPKHAWWGYVKSMVRKYPNRIGKEMCGVEAREFEAVSCAIQHFKKEKNGEEILKVIELAYWKHPYSLTGASMRLHWSYDSVVNMHRAFIRTVARYFRCDSLL